MNNPFEFKYPDEIAPSDVIDLFVPVFGEYYNVPIPGHTFINGARGSGKSMMFRFMKPDCQVLVDKNGRKLDSPRALNEIDYLAIYIPIKKGHLKKTDIKLNDKHGEALLNEHYMIVHFAAIIFKELQKVFTTDTEGTRRELYEFYHDCFLYNLDYCGYTEIQEKPLDENSPIKATFRAIINTLRGISRDFQHGYIKKLIGAREQIPYNGPLLMYSEFLYECLKEIRQLSFLPSKPIYLLIDDADELNMTQRKILNSWVSMRTTEEVSLKISTQLNYKVFRTVTGSRIDTPHDYSEVYLNDIYTTKKDVYYNRIEEIVTKRLEKYNCKVSNPEEYFPSDTKQEKAINDLKELYKKEQKKIGKSESQAYDFAYRYAVPDFIKNLKGNRYTFSYAGFKQLVNISSGIIREFIDFASEMYISQYTEKDRGEVQFISPSIQDKVIKEYSDKKLDTVFDKFRRQAVNKSDMDKLRNLLLGMGGLFHTILKSDSSERRVFSVALNNEPDDELKEILDLGVQYGYLQKSMIGNKYGTGKSRLYILSRSLSPHFGLDPSSFAGYKFMNSEVLKVSLYSPLKFIESLIPSIKGVSDKAQISIFERDGEGIN